MSTVKIVCAYCNNIFDKCLSEYNRCIRIHGVEYKFYCSFSCNAKRRVIESVVETKTCSCGFVFTTSTKATYCSLRCASLYSLTPERLEKMLNASINTRWKSGTSLFFIPDALRKREWYKYESLYSYLLCHEEEHQFEYLLPGTNHIFDLSIPRKRTLIEFDEIYHRSRTEEDNNRDQIANQLGWNVYRIDVAKIAPPYPYELIFPIMYNQMC